jgi:hypothetical protein
VMSSSTSRIVSTAYYDESGFKEDSTGKKIKFPIESYQGLEKATAERVRRFVDETKANLLRGRLESSPNLSSSRTTSGKPFFLVCFVKFQNYSPDSFLKRSSINTIRSTFCWFIS